MKFVKELLILIARGYSDSNGTALILAPLYGYTYGVIHGYRMYSVRLYLRFSGIKYVCIIINNTLLTMKFQQINLRSNSLVDTRWASFTSH